MKPIAFLLALLPATFAYGQITVVTSAADAGAGSLREAITLANGNSGADTITFDTTAMGGTTLALVSSLPDLSDDSTVIRGVSGSFGEPRILIDGQALSGVSTLLLTGNSCEVQSVAFVGNSTSGTAIAVTGWANVIRNCHIGVDRSGMTAIPNSVGILLQNGGGNTVGPGNVIAGNTDEGILVADSRDNLILGNIIGRSKDMTLAVGNATAGISISGDGHANRVGDGTYAGRNVIGSNGVGVRISGSDSNAISGNLIGVFVSGDAANTEGIRLENGASHTTIGGTTVPARNIISANTSTGLVVDGSSTRGTKIVGNWIGTDTTGTTARANQTGVLLQHARASLVGGSAAGEGNVISGNLNHGILLMNSDSNTIRGNFIGTTFSGLQALPNQGSGIVVSGGASTNLIGGRGASERNVISGNATHGLSLTGAGSDRNRIIGNHIGVGADGLTALGNAQTGVEFNFGASDDSVAYNTIAHHETAISFEDAATDSNIHYANSIFSNNEGVSIQSGAQGGIVPPTLQVVTLDTVVQGTSIPGAIIQIYADSSDQGRTLIDTTIADASGHWSKKIHVSPTPFATALQQSGLNVSAFSTPFKSFVGPIGASIATLDFGGVPVGSSDTLTIRIFSLSDAVAVGGQSLDVPGEFEILTSFSLPDTLRVGDTMSVAIRFAPGTFGVRTNRWNVVNASSISPFLLDLSGTGLAGSLSSVDTIWVDTTIVGDQRLFPVVVKAAGAPVQITAASTQSPIFGIPSLPALPYTVQPVSTDSLVVWLSFVPDKSGLLGDTLTIVSNSPAGNRYVILRGIGSPNAQPLAFAIQPVSASGITKFRRPTLTWTRAVDPNADTITYTIQIAKAPDFVALVQQMTTLDTFVTVLAPLDTSGAYYWRVIASDNKGATSTSQTLFFRVDAIWPSGSIYLLPSTILPSHVAIYVDANEALGGATVLILYRDANGVRTDSIDAVMEEIDHSAGLYHAAYSARVSGTMQVIVDMMDSAGNIAAASRAFTFAQLSKTRSMTTTDGKAHVEVVPNLRSGFAILSTVEMDTMYRVDVQSGVSLAGELRMHFSEEECREVGWQDPTRIGIYRMENGQRVFVGGSGKSGVVSAQIHKAGQYVLGYDASRTIVPKTFQIENYPNPFNPGTTLRVSLPNESDVKVSIHNILGQQIRLLSRGPLPAGLHTWYWDGRNQQGDLSASGIYFAKVRALGRESVHRMILLK